MRVLICATEYPPIGSGIANVIYNVVQELESMGVECTVCSPTGPDIKLGNSTHIKKYGILGMLEYWYQVSRYFKANDYYDFAWLHNPFILTGNPFRRCLVTMHSTYYGASTYWHSLGKRLYISLVAYIERYCLIRMPPNTSFTGVGQTVCDELEKIGIARDRMVYIPNGVNSRQFRPSADKKLLRRKLEIPEDDTILLSVGRLAHQKQPYTMIEVFSHLERKLDNVTLCIAGRGELLDEIKDLTTKKGLHKVLFLGYVDDRALPDLYACSDFYIMTSRYEGGQPPLTLAEGMASGLRCIVSDIPNLEIVREADCGIIINFDDISRASDQIFDYIMGNHSDHTLNARKYIVEQLNWHRIAEKYLAKLLEIRTG